MAVCTVKLGSVATDMLRGTYVGKLPHLIGQGAMLRRPPEPGIVLAQFDDPTLTRSDPQFQTTECCDESSTNTLGFGWHVFRASDFNIEGD